MRNEIKTIVEGVGHALGFKVSEICSASRKHELVVARQICYYIAFKDESHTQTEIGKFLGGRDHSTVIHGIQQIEDYRKTKYPLFLKFMEQINKYAPQIHSILKPIKVLRSNEPCAVTTFEINKYNN
jgi:chromosomal replication initiation ATPase DnaA